MLTKIKDAIFFPPRLLAMCFLFVCFLFWETWREIYGRLRHGKNWEPGGGVGKPEDY